MYSKVLILLSCLCIVFAQEYNFNDEPEIDYELPLSSVQLSPEQDESWNQLVPLVRSRRQLNVQGGGSRKQGLDLNIDARRNVWTSPNGRHGVDVTGGYAQHLGGPYGNSRPQWSAGGVYTYRF